MFERIMIAYDGSSGAERALEKAVGLARLSDAQLVVLTVYRHHAMLEASLSMVRGKSEPGANLDGAMRSAAKEAADQAKAYADRSGVKKVTAFIKSGPPARTIVAMANEKACDLIVVGSRGLGATEAYLVGSVSHKITSIADCPVMVV